MSGKERWTAFFSSRTMHICLISITKCTVLLLGSIYAIRLFYRFGKGQLSINVRITHYLNNSGILSGFFQFNNGDILTFLIGHQCLEDE
jgi:hypothetical protein